MSSRSILLSDDGGDRATAYGMSTKIVATAAGYICTWLDSARQNQWALVAPDLGCVRDGGTVGQPLRDNHCGAALARTADGAVHCVTGAHFGPFAHFRMTSSDAGWEAAAPAVAENATYPSLAGDGHGNLHLAFRAANVIAGRNVPYHLMVARWHPRSGWTEPVPVVRASVAEHTWLTNAVTVGPNDRIHLVLTNTREMEDGAYCFAASHLFSDDRGSTWRQFGGDGPLKLPANAASLDLIGTDEPRARRLLPRQARLRQTEPGPHNYYYCKILLSNPVVDGSGRPCVIVHNLLCGDASVYRHDGQDWTDVPLLPAVREVFPEWCITHAGQLGWHADGTLEAVLTVAPDGAGGGWGDPRTELVRVRIGQNGAVRGVSAVRAPDPSTAHWLPSLQREAAGTHSGRPALLYTRGLNAGGYGNNQNDVRTEVWLDLPHDD